MADFTRNFDAFDPNWLKQLAHSPLGGGFSDFLNEAHHSSSDSFCPTCRRLPFTAADEEHLARHLSALSLLRNSRLALNPAIPPPPAGLHLERLKTAAIAAAAATVRENNNSAASAYPRLPRVSPVGFSGSAPSPPPPEQQLRARKVVNGRAAARSDTLFERSRSYCSSTKGKNPEPTKGVRSGGVVLPLQKPGSRAIQSRMYPFEGIGSGLPRAGDLGRRDSSAGSGTGVFIPLAPPDSATDYLKSKLLISGKQRRDPCRVGRGAAPAGGGEVEKPGGKCGSSMEEGGRRSSAVDQKGGGGEEEDCHYHLPADLMGLPREWTY